MATVTLSVEELAQRIQQQCSAAFDHLNDLDAAHGPLDDSSSLDDALIAADMMGEEAWAVRGLLAEIRDMAASIERWAADPATDGEKGGDDGTDA